MSSAQRAALVAVPDNTMSSAQRAALGAVAEGSYNDQGVYHMYVKLLQRSREISPREKIPGPSWESNPRSPGC